MNDVSTSTWEGTHLSRKSDFKRYEYSYNIVIKSSLIFIQEISKGCRIPNCMLLGSKVKVHPTSEAAIYKLLNAIGDIISERTNCDKCCFIWLINSCDFV